MKKVNRKKEGIYPHKASGKFEVYGKVKENSIYLGLAINQPEAKKMLKVAQKIRKHINAG